MSFRDIEDAIRDSIVPFMSGTTIIFAHENGQHPNTPLCVIELTDFESTGLSETSTTTRYASGATTGTMTVREPFEVTAKFTFEGKNLSSNDAGDLALEFSTLLTTPLMLQEFHKNDISLLRKGIIKRIPIKRETAWYVSYAMSATFACYIERTQNVDGFDIVYVDGSYTDGS